MSDVISEIKINRDYFNLVPRPEPEQIKSLRNSMQEDGQQVKIIVNSQGVILDGHTRFMICKELGLEPKFTVKKFDSVQDEKEFVVSANLNRRQLTLFERGEILFSWWKKERDIGRSSGSKSTGKKERLLVRFARIIGSSASVCHQITWLLIHAPEEVKAKLRTEEITIASAYTFLKKPDRKTTADYIAEGRVYLRYPICLNCRARTVSAKENQCHVHSLLCCKKCGWGN